MKCFAWLMFFIVAYLWNVYLNCFSVEKREDARGRKITVGYTNDREEGEEIGVKTEKGKEERRGMVIQKKNSR
jgi:hypothetical protein